MTLRKRHSSSPTVGASLKAGMQIYSTRSSGAGLERASSYREANQRDGPRDHYTDCPWFVHATALHAAACGAGRCPASVRYFGSWVHTDHGVTMRHRLTFSLLALAACAPASTGRPTPAMPIVAAELRRDLYAFAADSFRGRETGTPELTRSARFIAQRLMAMGVEPAGDSLYYQRVPLIR